MILTKQNLGIILNIMWWSCEENCDYECVQKNYQLRIEKEEPIVQYHGKWPFKRVLGTQEFFSCIFSILNFVPHFVGRSLIAFIF